YMQTVPSKSEYYCIYNQYIGKKTEYFSLFFTGLKIIPACLSIYALSTY
ncbi:MAG: hypothetical protein ACI8V0_002981, partial [Pseudohongiellaceae bacterium]